MSMLVIYPYNDGVDMSVSVTNVGDISDIDNEFLKGTYTETMSFICRGNWPIPKNSFKYSTSLRKVWIPKTASKIEAPTPEESPFYGLSPLIQIFTDVIDSTQIPSSWGAYWNYYSESGQLNVNYNSDKAIYKAYVVTL